MNKVVEIKGSRDSASEKDIDGGAPKEYNRTPWSGNLDETEIARPGGLLLASLIRCANERRHQLNDMARELGVTYGYVNQLRNGIRNTYKVSDDFALACARYLGVPRLTVLMMAGRVTPEDAFESEEMFATEISRAMGFLVDDPEWGHLVTPELRKSSLESQYLLVRMYEKATGKVLMRGHLDVKTLAEEIRKLKQIQADRLSAVERSSARKKS